LIGPLTSSLPWLEASKELNSAILYILLLLLLLSSSFNVKIAFVIEITLNS
jgi:hypothetical protein